MKEKIVKIGTRGSPLALWQANHIASRIRAFDKNIHTELVPIKTRGDKILDSPLALIGGKGLFIKEIEQALLDGRADIAVHSMKDLPAELPEGLVLAAVPPREDPRDALIARNAGPLKSLPEGARVGTSSLRRKAQLLHVRPDLKIENIRGNLGTRLKKMESEGLDAIILAAAGVIRMEMEDKVSEFFEPSLMLPAVGQGALGIEIREDDAFCVELAKMLDDPDTRRIVDAERAFLHKMEGSCQIPVAAHACEEGGEFSIEGLISGIDGEPFFRDFARGSLEKAEEIASGLAEKLLKAGGQKVLDELKDK